jgi:hypothetical protein
VPHAPWGALASDVLVAGHAWPSPRIVSQPPSSSTLSREISRGFWRTLREACRPPGIGCAAPETEGPELGMKHIPTRVNVDVETDRSGSEVSHRSTTGHGFRPPVRLGITGCERWPQRERGPPRRLGRFQNSCAPIRSLPRGVIILAKPKASRLFTAAFQPVVESKPCDLAACPNSVGWLPP